MGQRERMKRSGTSRQRQVPPCFLFSFLQSSLTQDHIHIDGPQATAHNHYHSPLPPFAIHLPFRCTVIDKAREGGFGSGLAVERRPSSTCLPLHILLPLPPLECKSRLVFSNVFVFFFSYLCTVVLQVSTLSLVPLRYFASNASHVLHHWYYVSVLVHIQCIQHPCSSINKGEIC